MKLTGVGFAFLLLPLSVPATAASPQPVQATLTLPYETVLPGVPFDMTVTVKNVSSSSVAVGIAARLTVTLAEGTKVSTKEWHHLGPRLTGNEPTWVELAPGETGHYFVDWHDGTPSMFNYPDFSGPGSYELAFELQAHNPPGNYVGAIATNSVRLTRAVGAGEDEALWMKMMAAGHGRWSDNGFCKFTDGQKLLREILEIHPASAYYPYALLMESQFDHRPTTQDDIAKALEAAKRFPTSPAYSHLLLRAANIALGMGVGAAYRRDSKSRLEFLTLAERYYDDAAKQSTPLAVRAVAQRERSLAHDAVEREKQHIAGTHGKVQ